MYEELLTNLALLPLFEYAFVKTEQIVFSEKVQYICRTECEMYGKSWSCPPGVGTVEELKKKVLCFENAFLFSTVSENVDTSDFSAALKSVKNHTAVVRKVAEVFNDSFGSIAVASSEACKSCSTCSYPTAPCRKPQEMYPCIEAMGILVTKLAEECSLNLSAGANTEVWFGLIFFNANQNS